MVKLSAVFVFIFGLFACAESQRSARNQKDKMENHKHTNELIHETSPYLLQHAHNPVNWLPWGKKALELAKKEDKPIIISVGYAACHWCHVMEHECFEDEEVAKLMNEKFVCIKIDREERPDVDKVYMDAVHLMGQRGGWPLNCVALPDGKPYFGGTYFPKKEWMRVLNELSKIYQNDRAKVEEYADKLSKGIHASNNLAHVSDSTDFNINTLHESVSKWMTNIDREEGGPNHAPKFPLPNNYQFLLHYNHYFENDTVEQHLRLSLEKMAFGGLYDQVGGGFTRYSTDLYWKVPHFEKMLYDNGQLLSLYSEAYKKYKDPLYKEIVEQTTRFLERELMHPKGYFFSSLDADSEREEGKFYVWKKEELKELLGDEYDLAKDLYNINSNGLWEHGNYIPLRILTDAQLATKYNINVQQVLDKREKIQSILLKAREERVRPGLDDKTLLSWNALTISGYIDAYEAFGEKEYLERATKCADFIFNNMKSEDGSYFHSYKNGSATIEGFLEDYAFFGSALIKLYENTFDEKYLSEVEAILGYTEKNFKNKNGWGYFLNAEKNNELITRPIETQDNVIPSSNSEMGHLLFKYGELTGNEDLIQEAKEILLGMEKQIPTYGSGYSNYMQLALYFSEDFYEIAITGKECIDHVKSFHSEYQPNSIKLGAKKSSKLELLNGKFMDNTTIFVCVNRACNLPTEDIKVALELVR